LANEYFELCKLTLTAHTEAAGETLDETAYLESIKTAQDNGLQFEYRIDHQLAGFISMKDNGDGEWFVLLIVIHPDYRTRKVFMALFYSAYQRMNQKIATSIKSNVYKNNHLSVEFHKKLGFSVTRENDLGYEFTLVVESNSENKWLKLMEQKRHGELNIAVS